MSRLANPIAQETRRPACGRQIAKTDLLCARHRVISCGFNNGSECLMDVTGKPRGFHRLRLRHLTLRSRSIDSHPLRIATLPCVHPRRTCCGQALAHCSSSGLWTSCSTWFSPLGQSVVPGTCSTLELQRRGEVIRLQPQIGSNTLSRIGPAPDLMASITTESTYQSVAPRQLGSRRVVKSLAPFQLHHIMVAFQTGTLDEPPRIHRRCPMRIVKPAVFFVPSATRTWSLGEWDAHLKAVALPCPSWHTVHPKSAILCGLVAPKNKSSRGCPA